MNQTAKRIVAFTTLISFTASNTLAAIPNLQSIQGVNPDGQYNQGDTVDLTAKFDDFISPSPGSGLTVTLDVGPTTVDVPMTYSADSLVDRSFGVPGTLNATGKGDTNSEGIVMATELKQGDNAGRIVIVGSFTSYEGTTGQAKIMVLNPDGTIYRTFNADASQFTASNVQAVFETSEGKILVGGEFQNAWGNSNYDFLVQLNADFTLDTTFMNNVTANGTERGFNGQVGSSGTYGGANYYSANNPVIEHNGRLYITGDFDEVAGESYEFITCLNLDGTRCSGFSSPFSFGTRGMTLAIDGDKLWVGGQNMYSGGYQDLWRLNLDGSVDTTYVDRLAGDLIGGVVVLPEVSEGGTGGVAISGNSLDMASHVSSTDGSTVPTANNKPLFVINDDGTRNTLWDVQGEKFAAEPWSGEGFQLVKGKLFFGMHYADNDLAADDVRDTAGYYRNLDSVDCPANTTNGNNSTSDTCGLSSLIVFNTEDGSVNSEFMDVIGAQGAFIKDDNSDDIHDFELLSDGGLLVVGSFSSYRAESTDATFDDEAMIVKFRFDQLTGSYTVQSPATDLTGLVKTTGISSYQVQSIFDTATDTDGVSAYNTLVANEETLQDNSRYAFNRVLASAIELYAEDNTNPEPVLSDYTDLGVTGVTAANIAELNTIVDSLNGEDLDTTAEVQAMVDVYLVVQASDTPADGGYTAQDLRDIGLTDIDDAGLSYYEEAIDQANPVPRTLAELQAVIDEANAELAASANVLIQIGNEGDSPDVVDSVVTVTQLEQIIPAITGLVPDNEALYQDYIDENPDNFASPATAAEVQAMVDAVAALVAASEGVLAQIGNEADDPDTVNSVVTVVQLEQIIPEITGLVSANEAEYQNYIDANPGSFSSPATAAEVQAMVTAVNDAVDASNAVLTQIGNEGDDPDTVTSVVTVAQMQTIIPEITGLDVDNQSLYQDYIDQNPGAFSAPATAAEVQAMVDAVNAAVIASNTVLAQIGTEGDNPDTVNSVVTVSQIQQIIPEITGVVSANESLYQDYIDENPDSFSEPATAAEVQAMVDTVNADVTTSNDVLAQIGNEGDNPDVVDSVVTVAQIQTIIPEITGLVSANESLYQDYIDENPDNFSAPATAAEVQAMVDAVNAAVTASDDVLTQIGNEGDNPDVVDSVVTVAQIQTIIPEITGLVAGNEALYQDYIDANPDSFSEPATAAEVQALVNAVNADVNTSTSVLQQIASEGDNPDVTNSVVTVAQLQTIIPEITGLVAGNEALYQDYIDANPDNFTEGTATAAEVQAMVDAVNAAVTASDDVLTQIGNEGDNPDVVDSVVTVAQIQTIIPEITGLVAANEALYQDYIDENPDSFSEPATAAEVQAMVSAVNATASSSDSVLAQIGNEADDPDVVNSVVTVAQMQQIIPAITGLVSGNESLYQDYIDENPAAFSAPATAAEVQAMVDAVNAAVTASNDVLAQIGNEGDNPDVVDSVVTVAQIQTIIPEITGLIAGNEALYQDYIDANPDSFSEPATAAEVQSMVNAVNADVNTSTSVLQQIASEGDNPDVNNSVVTVAQLQTIIPEITGLVAGNEALYQDYIDANPDSFTEGTATAAEVQAMVDAVNAAVTASNDVLAQIGNEGDNPDVVDSVVTVAQIQTIIPEITGLVTGNEALYQDYIDANPDSFSEPATASEVQAMVDAVNAAVTTSDNVLAQIGTEGDNPDVVDSVVTAAQIQTIIPEITDVVAGNESLYQDYIDENPDAFSSPATAAEVQAMVDAVNAAVTASNDVLAQIGNEGDNPDVVDSVVTVTQIQTIIPEITGVVAGNESLYQDYIDENPDAISSPATAAEVQSVINNVNAAVTASDNVLAQIGNEGDNPDTVNSVVTVSQIQQIIPEITGVVSANESLYQDYIDENPDSFSEPATAAEVQAMVDAVNAAVTASNDVLAQIGNEGDNPDVVDSVVTVTQIETIIPEITGAVAGNESLYQDYIDENPDAISSPATASEVQSVINNVNAAVTASDNVLAQIATEGDNPDVTNSVVTVSQIQQIIPEITGVVSANESLYQDYIDENPDSFSEPATAAEVQAMIDAVAAAVTASNDVLAQIGNEGDNPDVVDSVVTVAQIQTIIPEITGVIAGNESLYQDYIDANPDSFSAPATAAEVQVMVNTVNASNSSSDSVLAQIGNEADDPDVVNSVVTVAQMQQIIPAITGLVSGNESLYQDYIDENPAAFSAPATAAEVQAMVDAVNAAVNASTTVLQQIAAEGDNPDVNNSVVTVAQIQTILPEITGVIAGNEALYQDYIDENPDSFTEGTATAAEVQAMVTTVNADVSTSTSVLQQVATEGDNPDVNNSVVTVAQLQTIIPEITGLVAGNEALYQDYIDENPDSFTEGTATAAEVQAMVDAVNAAVTASNDVLAQIGNEGDNPDVVDSVVTVTQIQTIIPEITGVIAGNESLYQDYIDENPDAISSPATASEVQSVINSVNAAVAASDNVLAQIGTEGDNPDTVNSVVTVSQIQQIIPEITGVVSANESLYQDYIDENPDSFSAPATAAEVQAMVDAVAAAVTASNDVLAQIGNEGDNPDVVDSVVTVTQIETIIPEITGVIAGNESLYQDYIDANPDNFSEPATAAEVQVMVNTVNASNSSSDSVLAQIGNEADDPDVVNSVVTVAQMQQIIPAITGLVSGNESLYQDYIDENPAAFSAPATAAEVQAMVDAVNAAVTASNDVLAQIGNEGDNPDVVDSVVTVTQIQTIIPEITGVVAGNESLYQDYIDENPDAISSPATAAEVQSVINSVNAAVTASDNVLAQIGTEGDNPDTVNSVVTVSQIQQIIPEITGVVSANEGLYQDYIDENPDSFSAPATAAEVQAMVDAVAAAVTASNDVLAQIGSEGDNPDVVDSVVTVTQIETIIPEITGVIAGNESLYQDYIDANPDNFSEPATAAEVQVMVNTVNASNSSSDSVLAQIGNEADDPDVVNSVVTVAQMQQIIPAITGLVSGNESLYQDYIDENPAAFSAPATAAEVQAMVDAVNAAVTASNDVLAQIGNEGDNPDVVDSVVTVTQIQTIIPEITGLVAANESLYQDYIDENPEAISSPATAAEVQSVINNVNAAVTASDNVLAQIGNEGDNPDVTNSVVTVSQIQQIIPEITGVVSANESLYQDYIDENPDSFSEPATAAEVQAMVDAVAAAVTASNDVLAQIGNEGDNPDVVDSVVTVTQIQSIIPEITGLVAANEGLYQDYIDANPDSFSAPATASEVQAMVQAVNATTSSSAGVLAQIGNEGDNPDVVNSVVTVAQMQQIIPAITGLVGANQALYQDYIDENPDSFSAPATAAEVQAMVTAVNNAVIASNDVLAQIGNEGDNPDVVDSVVTVTQIEAIIPEVTGVVAGNESLYQDYIDENPDRFSAPATVSQVQLMVDAVNDAVTASNNVLAQIGSEGDNPDTVDSEISVAQMQQIIPEITGLVPANQSLYQDYIDINPDNFSAPATAAEVQDMVNAVNDAVIRSKAILAQIGSEADEPDTVESVVTVEQLRQILPAVDGVVDDNEALYQTYIDSRPNAFSEPATVGQVQIMIDRVNASQEALLEILEDSAAEDGANNANGEAVTVQEIASITGITGVNFDLEDEYQAAIAAETDFSNPPTLEEVQAVIDQVNAANTNQAPGNPGTDEVAPDGSLEFSKSAGSVSLLWIMLAMLLVLARVLRNRRWLSPVAALLAVSSAAVAEEGKGLESLWVSVGEPEETALAENSKSDQPEEISRLYLTGGGLYSEFSPSSDGVDVESESDTGLGLGLGYDISDQLSVEASYLSHGEFRVVNNADNNEAALDYSSANIRLNWFPQFIGNQNRHAGYSRDGVFSWFLSAGLNYVMGDVTGPVDIDKDQSVVLGYGAGIAYGLTDQLDTFLSFNRISGDLDSVSAGVRFHFGLEQPAASNIPVAVPSVTAFVEPTVLSTPQPEMAVLPDCISCTPVGSVFFAFDSSALSDEFYPMLEELLQRISNDEFRGSILIVGFADSLGSSDYNLALAHRRAKAVSGYLIDHGLDRFLIDVDSEGRLLTPNILEASKRRVDIFVKNADLKPVSWID